MNATQQRKATELKQYESQRINPADVVVMPKHPRTYPFRTLAAILFLLINFLVAAIYFHIINP